MANELVPQDQSVIAAASSHADRGGDHNDHPFDKAAVDPGAADQNAAEQCRSRAEEARQIGERHRTAAEAYREERERLRERAEMDRARSEEARVAADTARDEVVESVRAAVENLKATLDRMAAVEAMRRILRDARDNDSPQATRDRRD